MVYLNLTLASLEIFYLKLKVVHRSLPNLLDCLQTTVLNWLWVASGFSGNAGLKVPMPGQSMTTLYVRNLPSSAKEEEILSVFQNFGTIREARFQKSKETQEFFGSVFIEYIHASAARLAQIQLNEKSWGDRTVHIDFAKERVSPKEEKGAVINNKEQFAVPSNSLYVSNLSQDCDKPALMQLFARFGTIIDVRPLKNESGNAKGVAFIDFALLESAAAAIDALDNTVYNNKTIKVSFAANPSKRKGEEAGQGDLKRFRGDATTLGTGYPSVGMYYDPSQLGGYPTGAASHDQSQWYGQGFY
jgi:RNA recognition motif-containing protein